MIDKTKLIMWIDGQVTIFQHMYSASFLDDCDTYRSDISGRVAMLAEIKEMIDTGLVDIKSEDARK